MSDWPEVRISELATIDIGGTPSRAIPTFWAEKPSGFPWISIADLKGKYVSDTKEHITALGVRSSNVKLIPERTTVMSFKLTVGRTAITAMEMYCNEAIAIFQPKDRRLDAGWLYHALPRAAGSVVTDTAVKGATLNKAKMAEISLQLPPPAEQVIIAQVLDTLDTAIHETEAIIAKLKAVKQGLLHDLLTRGIDTNGELRPPQAEAPHLYKDSPLGWIPKEWEASPLEKITGTPICYGIVQVLGFVPDGVPVLAIKDLHGDYTTGIHRTSASIDAAYARSRVRPGDVLLSIKGTLGKVGVVPSHFTGNISRDIALLRPSSHVRSRYLAEMLQSTVGQGLISLAHVGTTRGEISIAPLRRIVMPVPPPSEQQRIEASCEGAGARLRHESLTLQKRRWQKAGLMDDLLTGRVRVTPLLEAEPA